MLHLHGCRGVVAGGILDDSVFTDEKSAIEDDPEEEDSSPYYYNKYKHNS